MACLAWSGVESMEYPDRSAAGEPDVQSPVAIAPGWPEAGFVIVCAYRIDEINQFDDSDTRS